MNTFSHVPPGFRFHPTDEELVDYYLRKKVASKSIDLDVIKDVDLYKIEPWDLQELCKIGSDDESDWYFFSHKDKKYPTGTRTNRATKAGFWKATGRDKAIYLRQSLIGMRKTLVFYKGRAPNGYKSDWIMHEYRLETIENATPQEEGWVVCRVFKKRMTMVRRMDSPYWYDDQVSFMPDQMDDSPPRGIMTYPNLINNSPYRQQYHYHCKQELESPYNTNNNSDNPFFQLPQLESPKLPHGSTAMQSSSLAQVVEHNLDSSRLSIANNYNDQVVDQVMDWRALDKFVASQLSHDHDTKQDKETNNYSINSSNVAMFHVGNDNQLMSFLTSDQDHPERLDDQMVEDYASTSTSLITSHIGLWK